MMTGYVRTTWAPKATKMLLGIHARLQADLDALGEPVPANTENKVLSIQLAIKSLAVVLPE
eukprot:scaffold263045_cov34-Prasinocladus_malaysianus.AAC.1